MFTIWRLLIYVKSKYRPGAVIRSKCSDCQVSYIGQTGRNLTTRLNKHKRATKKGDLNNNIAKPRLKTSHNIDWDYQLLSTNYTRKLVYSEQTALNRCQPLPAPYRSLLNRKQQHIVCYSFHDPSICVSYLLTHLRNQSHHTFTNSYSIYWPITSLTTVFEFSTD